MNATDELKQQIEKMPQKVAAQLLGVTPRTLRLWHEEYPDGEGPPRNHDGTYHHHALLWWHTAQKLKNQPNRKHR